MSGVMCHIMKQGGHIVSVSIAALLCKTTELCRKKEHVYGKLAPQAVNSTLLAEDGEANFTTKDKKDPSDFALWKAAKPGEPSWPSPKCVGDAVGKGRPGQLAQDVLCMLLIADYVLSLVFRGYDAPSLFDGLPEHFGRSLGS